MSFREKSAWVMAGTLVISYGWYFASVVMQLADRSVADVAYRDSAVAATLAVVVVAAVSHAVLAALGPSEITHRHASAGAIKRYARSTGGVVVAAAAVVGMALAMFEADHFWIANVILAGLVVAEVTAAGSEILIYRRGA